MNADDLIPLRPVVFGILLVLLEENRHGYAIMKEVSERALGGKGALGPGTLYRTLSEMQQLGLIERCESPQETGEDERRRYYSVTPLGRRVAAMETDRMRGLVAVSHKAGVDG